MGVSSPQKPLLEHRDAKREKNGRTPTKSLLAFSMAGTRIVKKAAQPKECVSKLGQQLRPLVL